MFDFLDRIDAATAKKKKATKKKATKKKATKKKATKKKATKKKATKKKALKCRVKGCDEPGLRTPSDGKVRCKSHRIKALVRSHQHDWGDDWGDDGHEDAIGPDDTLGEGLTGLSAAERKSLRAITQRHLKMIRGTSRFGGR